jgi:dTDP-4-amino-4,6-dideoxygalactose transaminase
MQEKAAIRRGPMRSITDSAGGSNGIVRGRLIPSPDAPNHPVLSTAAFTPGAGRTVPSILDSGRHVELTSGRYAIALAAELLGFRPGDEILLPAYHCSSMVDPMLKAGAKPVFYRVQSDLSVDLNHVEELTGNRTRALLAVNYFGFPQDLLALRAYCDAAGILLVEDCAHCFFGTVAGRPVGSFGDFAVGSYWKFFPVIEGGCLVIRNPDLPMPDVARDNVYMDLKTAYNTLEQAINYNRLWLLQPFVMAAEACKNVIRNKRPAGITDETAVYHEIDGDGFSFDPDRIHTAMTRTTQAVVSWLSFGRVTAKRRQHYRRMLDGLGDLANGRPLLGDIGDNVVPYVFPFYVDRMDAAFPRLEDAAVPMQRFGQFLYEDVTPETCAVTADYSRNVIQLPCHQELTDGELESIIQRTREIVR